MSLFAMSLLFTLALRGGWQYTCVALAFVIGVALKEWPDCG